MVISIWESMEDWIGWRDSEERKEIDSKIEALQVKPTSYESYVFKKYRISVQEGFPEQKG
jgi:heme-degrading monooxygenase HmoA